MCDERKSLIGLKDVFVIVRSSGERTENECVRRLVYLFGDDNVSVIRGITPFSLTVKKTFELSLRVKKKWTLVVDADVIIFSDRVEEFIIFANKLVMRHPDAFVIQPYVWDCFFDDARFAGIHLYNTSCISCESIKYIDQQSLRAETSIQRRMNDMGYPTYGINMILGIHDYFQNYESIVKKGMLHANKFPANTISIDQLREKSVSNRDYYYFLLGMKLGLKNRNEITNDRNVMGEIITKENIIFEYQPTIREEDVDILVEEIKKEFVSFKIFEKSKDRGQMLRDALLQWSFFRVLKRIKDKFHLREVIE